MWPAAPQRLQHPASCEYRILLPVAQQIAESDAALLTGLYMGAAWLTAALLLCVILVTVNRQEKEVALRVAVAEHEQRCVDMKVG